MDASQFAEAVKTWLHIDLQPHQIEAFEQYVALIHQWNQRFNLTGLRTQHDLWVRLILDSLSAVQITGSLDDRWVIDVGTGAGIPGIPLKLLFPDMHLVLVESVGKKTAFLQEVIKQLNLNDVSVFQERAEMLARDYRHREQYDWALARALGPLNVVSEYILPFVRMHGHALVYKGPKVHQELEQAQAALATLGGRLEQVRQVQVPWLDAQRYLVIIRKIAPTPKRYPRKPGIPAKRPLT